MTRRRNPDEETPPETTPCEHCGEEVPSTQPVVATWRMREQDWCPTCVSEEGMACANCHTLTASEECQDVEGEAYCNTCADDIPTCEHCEERHAELSPVHIREYPRRGARDIEAWCDGCREDSAWTCDSCSVEYTSDVSSGLVDGDQNWCDSCSENSYFCEDCGEAFSQPHEHESDDDGVADYHSTDFSVIDSPWVRFQPKPIYFGVELEVEVSSGKREAYVANVRDSMGPLLAGIENDGSLNHGFEIITHPAGLDIHRKYWAESDLSGLKSHDTTTCGLHIHVSRNAMSKYTIGKLAEFSNAAPNLTFMETFARRAYTGYAKRVSDMTIVRSTKRRPERYEAWNLTNDDTIEFRLPKGTTEQTTILATLEFVFALIRFCEHASAKELTTENFKRFIVRDEWHYDTKFLRAYMVKRGLATAKEMGLAKPKPGSAPPSPESEDASSTFFDPPRTNPRQGPSYTQAALQEYLQEGEPDWGA